MADSKTTRLLFINVFKELMGDIPFHKINIADICRKCDKNRKSFYYHFKDKYDLANQTFDEEFQYLDCSVHRVSVSFVVKELCCYLYENRCLYRKLFAIEGQNCFSEHLKNKLRNFFEHRINDSDRFSRIFWADAIFYSIKEWILNKKCIHYSEFYVQLLTCIRIEELVS